MRNEAKWTDDTPIQMACHRKNGPGKNGPAGPILDEKIVRPDQFWSTKNDPAGPFLVTKSDPGWLKMVRCQELSNNVST